MQSAQADFRVSRGALSTQILHPRVQVEIWIDGTHVGGHIGRRWRELEAIGRLSDAWFGSFRS
ncbi:MAG TPA: hypothetical protein VF665_19855, partial [Longimicrobium sp.]|uniref:hypothetical protein n=1 Tax=Longimicrobium sp. TaxID=2029185 RepID=UPI002ED9EBA1